MAYMIEVEGISGAGKTTVVPHIQKFLEDNGYSTFSFYEPGTTKLGRTIRKLVLDNNVPGNYHKVLTKLLLFLTNRADIRSVFSREIESKDFAIVDRYYGSTYVYQIMSLASEVEQILLSNVLNAVMGAITSMTSYSNSKFVDTTVLLNVSPETAFKRVKKRASGKKEKIYKVDFEEDEFIQFNEMKQKQFLDYFYSLERSNRNMLIDASQKLPSVKKELDKKFKNFLDNYNVIKRRINHG
jgi:dTMP kinase